MSPDAVVKSLEFQYNDAISSIKVNLTEGTCSPTFQSSGGTAQFPMGPSDHEHPKTLMLDPAICAQIRYIKAGESGDCLQQIYFLDAKRNEIASYDPYGLGSKRGREIELRPNEELVGVYGAVSERCNWLTSFGFMTKIKG